MHYYTKNIADFNNATRHLTRQERSIYSDLIELQYDLESPIPNDLTWICRRILATSESERTDVERMLNEFFDLVEQGWSNARCEHEIERFTAKQAQAKAAGKASGEARRRNKKPNINKDIEQTLNGRSTDVQRTLNQPITNNQEPIQTHSPPDGGSDPPDGEPVGKKSDPPDKAIKPCPVQKIIDLYNERVIRLPKVRVVADDTRRKISARWKSDPRFQRLEFWGALFDYCEKNHFLSGRAESRSRDSPFLASLDWIVQPTNFAKILNKKYDRVETTPA